MYLSHPTDQGPVSYFILFFNLYFSLSNFHFLQGAQTIKRSYSLSDLSETDGDVVDGRHQPFKEQAPIRHRASLRIKNVATRSSSLTKRPISEIYFPEVELKDGGGHVAATDYR